jgi:hypothetical protein
MRMPNGTLIERWVSGPILVTSSLQTIEAPDRGPDTPQWLIGISERGKRPKPHHVRRALRAFDMTEAENDAHHPGVACHYFLVVDPARRVTCECKTTEDIIVEPDGYRWTNPKPESGEACRGCEYARLAGSSCPIHISETA